jgi:hypothetical protein
VYSEGGYLHIITLKMYVKCTKVQSIAKVLGHYNKKCFRQKCVQKIKNLYRKSKICTENKKFVKKIKNLYRKSKIYTENQKFVQKIKNLYRKSKICTENQKFIQKIKNLYRKSKHILCSITPPPQNRAVCEIIWKKYGISRQATDGSIIRHMRFAC